MKANQDSKDKKRTRDGALMAIAAMIQPLPENVLPSERFLKQMRKHLLSLHSEFETNYRAA